jgi:hypothetical protein
MRTPSCRVPLFAIAALLSVACGSREPAAACETFVACIEARDAQRDTTTDVARFAEGGACWTASEEGALACARACERGLEVTARLSDAPQECR